MAEFDFISDPLGDVLDWGKENILDPVVDFGGGLLSTFDAGNSNYGGLWSVLGWGLGMMLGGSLYPSEAERTSSQTMGPAQLMQPQSNYGGVVTVLKGCRRIAGNLIWYDALAGSSPNFTVSFAYAVCIGPSTVLRIYWGKNEYVCDPANGAAYKYTTEIGVPPAYIGMSAADLLQVMFDLSTPVAFTYTEYDGTQTTADPTILASKTGTDQNVPPWTNLHYLVFVNFPIASTPQIPLLSFEVAEYVGMETPTWEVAKYTYDLTYNGVSGSLKSLIYHRGRIYLRIYADTGVGGFHSLIQINPLTMAVEGAFYGSGSTGVTEADMLCDGWDVGLSYNTNNGWTVGEQPSEYLTLLTRTTLITFSGLSRVKRLYLGKVTRTGTYYQNISHGGYEITDRLCWNRTYKGSPPAEWEHPYQGIVIYDTDRQEYIIFCDGGASSYLQYVGDKPIVHILPQITAGQQVKGWFYDKKYYVLYDIEGMLMYNQGDFSLAGQVTAASMFGIDYMVRDCFNYSRLGIPLILVVGDKSNVVKVIVLNQDTLAVVSGPFTVVDDTGEHTTFSKAVTAYHGRGSNPSYHAMVACSRDNKNSVFGVNLITGTVDLEENMTDVNPAGHLFVTGPRGRGKLYGGAAGSTNQLWTLDWEPEKYMADDVSPQHVSNYVMTDEFTGIGLDESILDAEKCDEAETYAEENDMLISPVFDTQRSVLDTLQYILQHHNGYVTSCGGKIAHRQLEIEGEEIIWEQNDTLSDSFLDNSADPKWRVLN